MSDIRGLPVFVAREGEKGCTGCEKCVTICPGLAISLVDYRKDPEMPTVTLIGCGTGNLTELLRERYPRNPLWVTDLAPAMVDSAQRRVEARYGTGPETSWQAVDIRTELARLMCTYDRAYMAPEGGVTVTWCVQYLRSIKA